jgi:hypothetical protein
MQLNVGKGRKGGGEGRRGGEGMVQVIECLPSKHKALRLIPSTKEKKNSKIKTTTRSSYTTLRYLLQGIKVSIYLRYLYIHV